MIKVDVYIFRFPYNEREPSLYKMKNSGVTQTRDKTTPRLHMINALPELVSLNSILLK